MLTVTGGGEADIKEVAETIFFTKKLKQKVVEVYNGLFWQRPIIK